MKKFTKIAAVLFALLLCGSLFGYDDDEPAPGRSHRRGGILNKTLSVGLMASYHMNITYEIDGVEQSSTDINEKYFGLTARFFPFMGGKLGAGLDMILLDSNDYASLWQVDFNILLRFKVARRLTVNGGIGWSQYVISWEDGSDATTSDLGYNVKVGAEYFFARSFSVSGDFKWTVFTWDDSFAQENKQTTLSFQLGLHYWL